MSKYFYKALKDNGREIVSGYIDASTSEEAHRKIKLLGFIPTKIYEEDFIPKEEKPKVAIAVHKIKLMELIHFTQEFQMLLDSGISILEALDSIARHAPSKRISLFSRDLFNKVKKGETFTQAIDGYSEVLGNVYVALCRSGEESGSLPIVLKYLTNLLKKRHDLRNRLIQLSIYPSILIVVLIGIFILFGQVVFPNLLTFSNLPESEIPILVKFMIGTTNAIFNYWIIWLAAITGGAFGISAFGGVKSVMKNLSGFFMKVPLINECMRYISLAHYMAVLHVGYNSGVTIIKSLALAEGTITNPILNRSAKQVTNDVEKGSSLTDALHSADLLPAVMLSMVATGEKTGKLGDMFRDISIAIDDKLDTAMKALSAAFQPILLLIMGIVTAIVAVGAIQMFMRSLTNMF